MKNSLAQSAEELWRW